MWRCLLADPTKMCCIQFIPTFQLGKIWLDTFRHECIDMIITYTLYIICSCSNVAGGKIDTIIYYTQGNYGEIMKFLVPSRIDSLQLATKPIMCLCKIYPDHKGINVTTLQGTVRLYPAKPEVRKIIGLKSAGGQTIHLTNSLKVIFLGSGLKSVFF